MHIPIVRLQMSVDRELEYFREQISTPGKAAEWLDKNIIRNSSREHIVIVCCDASGRAAHIDVAAVGSRNFCPAAVSELFKAAVISNASGILMFHSHPSGDPAPSRMDCELTQKVRKAGELMEIELLDHIITGSGGKYYSFRENSRLDGSPDDC